MAAAVWVFLSLVSFCDVAAASKENALTASVIVDKDGKTLVIKSGIQEPNIASGSFWDEIQETGWSYLEVHTNQSETDENQAQGAGMLEGYLTSDLITKHYQNLYASYCQDEQEFCEKLIQFVQKNFEWVLDQVHKNPTDDYWHQVALIYQQYEGLQMGYRHNTSAPEIAEFGFYLMQASGDLGALEQVLKKKTLTHVHGSGSCSALVKLLPGNKELFISQDTWTEFTSMLRIFKLYDFHFSRNGEKGDIIPGQKQAFSSYPGSLLSGDDFYLLSSGLVSQETTIGNSNSALWSYVTTEDTVQEWLRNIVANRLARTAGEWCYIFSRFNSGTYNNQWMVLDYKQFTPGKDLKLGTLWILEQIPGIVEMADMTAHLQDTGYWASYNLPYFRLIYDKSGVPDSVKKFGPWFDYHQNPRAQIFKRDQGKVVDMKSLFTLMRYNDFKNDPLSRCNCTPPYSGENAISARSDLNPADGKYPFGALGHRNHGGTDCKATSYELFQKFSCKAVSGPTHDQQPVFQWSTSGWKKPLGHPDKWDFEPVLITWD